MAYIMRPCFVKTAKMAGISTAIAFGACVVAYKLHKVRNSRNKAKDKRKMEYDEIIKQLQNLEGSDADERDKILKMSPIDLIQYAKQGRIDPIKILQSYMYKACHDTQKLNSITGIIKECFEVASKLPENQEKGLLYGLPVSLKESMRIKGTDSTIGLSNYIGINATEDCVIAQVLKHCGAIPFVKTNIVQLMLSFEGSNPIYGESHNPHNLRLTTGGSSAGEGALVGSGGSPLGFGTDIAGSIRVPAHLCGIAGFKPTKNRISMKGLHGSLPGQTLLSATLGPMAKDVDTLEIAMRALLCPKMFQLDSNVPPLPFNEEIYCSKRKLVIGYYDDNGYNKPIPAIQRALHIAKDALEKAGHTVVKFPVPDVGKAMEISTAAIYADGGKHVLRNLKYDQIDIRGKEQYRKWTMSPFCRIVKYYFTWLKSPRIARDDYAYGGGDGSVDRLWGLVVQANSYRKQFHDLWHDYQLDALICPPFPVVAGEKGSISNMTSLMSYTTLYTLLNYPAGVVPVTKVSPEDVRGLKNYKGHFGDSWDDNIKTACKNAEGMPVAVQCVAPTWQDEMCLRVMKEIESLVQYS